jgi:hypothetical protein
MNGIIEDWMRPGARVARIELDPDLLTEDGVLTSLTVANPLPDDVEIKRVAVDQKTRKTVVYVQSASFAPRMPQTQPQIIDPQIAPALSGGSPWTFLWTVRQWMLQDPNRND